MHSLVRTGFSLLVLLAAGAASAGTLSITYQVDGGSFTTPSIQEPIPLDFGSFTLTFQANGSANSNIQSGPALLGSLVLFGYNMYGTANAEHSRQFFLNLPGGAAGTGTAGGGFAASPFFYFYGSANFHCGGPACPVFGYINSMSYGNIFTGSGPTLGFQIFASSATGVAPTLFVRFSSVPPTESASLQITGQEVSRVFVPEPHSGGLLALGLLGLTAYGTSRSARTGKRSK